jgi:hypothetical protein
MDVVEYHKQDEKANKLVDLEWDLRW